MTTKPSFTECLHAQGMKLSALQATSHPRLTTPRSRNLSPFTYVETEAENITLPVQGHRASKWQKRWQIRELVLFVVISQSETFGASVAASHSLLLTLWHCSLERATPPTSLQSYKEPPRLSASMLPQGRRKEACLILRWGFHLPART